MAVERPNILKFGLDFVLSKMLENKCTFKLKIKEEIMVLVALKIFRNGSRDKNLG